MLHCDDKSTQLLTCLNMVVCCIFFPNVHLIFVTQTFFSITTPLSNTCLKKNYSYHLSLKFIFFICLKKNFQIIIDTNYKLLAFTKKKKKKTTTTTFEHTQHICLEASYLYYYLRGFFYLDAMFFFFFWF